MTNIQRIQTTVIQLQDALGAWHRGKWGSPSKTFMAAKLAEEVGEVCEAALKDEQGHPKAGQLNYGEELADVVIVALCAADIHGIDLQSEIMGKIRKLGIVLDYRDSAGHLVCGVCGDEVAYCSRNHQETP